MWQEQEIAGHTVSAVKRQRVVEACAQLDLPFSRISAGILFTFRVDFLSSVNFI